LTFKARLCSAKTQKPHFGACTFDFRLGLAFFVVAKCRQFTEEPIFACAKFLLQYDGVFGVDTISKKIRTKNGSCKFAYRFMSKQKVLLTLDLIETISVFSGW
jgi:hypothetical protein